MRQQRQQRLRAIQLEERAHAAQHYRGRGPPARRRAFLKWSVQSTEYWKCPAGNERYVSIRDFQAVRGYDPATILTPSAYGVPANPNSLANFVESKR